MNLFEEYQKELSQEEIYSPSPTIKIVKWNEKICKICRNCFHEFGEYDNEGYYICDEEGTKLEGLKCFPNCSAKSCKKFTPKCLSDNDGWAYLDEFEKAFGNECYKKLAIYLDYKKRMGDYTIGRLL